MTKTKFSGTQTKNRGRLGQFLKDRRKKAKLSQLQLATHLGYETPQYISDWERGIYSPPMKKLPILCELLSIKQEIFFRLMLQFSREKLEAEMTAQFQSVRQQAKKSNRRSN